MGQEQSKRLQQLAVQAATYDTSNTESNEALLQELKKFVQDFEASYAPSAVSTSNPVASKYSVTEQEVEEKGPSEEMIKIQNLENNLLQLEQNYKEMQTKFESRIELLSSHQTNYTDNLGKQISTQMEKKILNIEQETKKKLDIEVSNALLVDLRQSCESQLSDARLSFEQKFLELSQNVENGLTNQNRTLESSISSKISELRSEVAENDTMNKQEWNDAISALKIISKTDSQLLSSQVEQLQSNFSNQFASLQSQLQNESNQFRTEISQTQSKYDAQFSSTNQSIQELQAQILKLEQASTEEVQKLRFYFTNFEAQNQQQKELEIGNVMQQIRSLQEQIHSLQQQNHNLQQFIQSLQQLIQQQSSSYMNQLEANKKELTSWLQLNKEESHQQLCQIHKQVEEFTSSQLELSEKTEQKMTTVQHLVQTKITELETLTTPLVNQLESSAKQISLKQKIVEDKVDAWHLKWKQMIEKVNTEKLKKQEKWRQLESKHQDFIQNIQQQMENFKQSTLLMMTSQLTNSSKSTPDRSPLLLPVPFDKSPKLLREPSPKNHYSSSILSTVEKSPKSLEKSERSPRGYTLAVDKSPKQVPIMKQLLLDPFDLSSNETSKTLIASGGKDKLIKVWDCENKVCIASLTGHTGNITGIVAMNNNLIVSSSEDETIRIWSVDSGQCIGSISVWSAVTCLLTWDSKRVICGTANRTIKILNVESKKCEASFKSHSFSVQCMAKYGNQETNKLVTCGNKEDSYEKCIKLWDLTTGQCLSTIVTDHVSAILSVVVLPHNLLVVTGSQDKRIKLWNMETKQCIGSYQGHSDSIQSLAVLFLSPQQQWIISGSADNCIKLWNVQTGECERTLQNDVGVLSVAVLDERRIISADIGGKVKIWDITTRELLHTSDAHSIWANVVAVL